MTRAEAAADLGVAVDAPEDVVRGAFRRIAARVHADRPDGDPVAYARAVEACAVLTGRKAPTPERGPDGPSFASDVFGQAFVYLEDIRETISEAGPHLAEARELYRAARDASGLGRIVLGAAAVGKAAAAVKVLERLERLKRESGR